MPRSYSFPFYLILVGLGLAGGRSQADPPGFQFRADYYQRDLQTNSLRGKGRAWLKQGDKEVWADEVEIDFNTSKAIANGNVQVKEPGMEMWCSHITYFFNGEEATLEDATIVSKQLVMMGAVIRKKSKTEFEIDEGSYSNCNVDLITDKNVGKCPLDWKLYGKHFSITTEGYAHIHDAVIYTRDFPIFYSPYFIFPVKSKRQSGFLQPQLNFVQGLGSGVTLPYYIALDSWHDLTINPTHYSLRGYHVGLNYRYHYSDRRQGFLNTFFTQRRFSEMPDPRIEDRNRPRLLGVIGEWAVDAHNYFWFGERSHSRQTLRLLSNPFYTHEYAADLTTPADVAALRSQLSVTLPDDNLLFTGRVTHHQSLVISKDSGVDEGAVTELPALSFSRISTPFLGKYLSYEVDTNFTNFFRPAGFDQVPDILATGESAVNYDPNRAFDANDYIRTGRRMQVEPRLVAHVPMPPGFQFQPVLKAGSLLYHFDYPKSQLLHREYLQAEFPVSMYLSKSFSTGISGFEKIAHVFQPRFIYATSPYQSAEGDHPFFLRERLSNPRFDIVDQVTNFQFMRFELINRFLRAHGGGVERFFSLQLSEQFNLHVPQTQSGVVTPDPRFRTRLGPVELLAEARIWRFTAQMQANYALELTNNTVRESDWSSSIAYTSPDQDLLRLNSRIVNKADPAQSQQLLYLTLYKRLPIFFDVGGQMEYSLKHGRTLAHMIGFYFEAKPRSCWGLGLETGRTSFENSFTRLSFKLLFGRPDDVNPL